MPRRVALSLAVLLTAAVAVLGAAAVAAADDAPTPLSPDDASALIAGSAVSGTSSTTMVDPSTALAAASLPGAVTSVEPDLTLDQAVGLDPATTSTSESTASMSLTGDSSLAGTSGGSSLATFSSPTWCWANAYWSRWGTWPYEQKITDTTFWCAVYGSKITYRTSSVTGGGTLCSMNWRTSQLIAGGVGFPSFTMRSSAGFSCPTVIPWIVLHPTHYIDVRRGSRGGTALVASS